MSERIRNVVTAVVLATMAVALAALVLTNPTDADRVEAIGERIKCPVCQGESIANSPSEMARDMMSLVEERVEQGASDEAIVDDLLASYSGAVLLDPPVSGSTLILWLAPLGALVVGAWVILWWKSHPSGETLDPGPRPRSGGRRLVPLLILAGAFAIVVVVAGFFLQEREGPASGVAGLAGENLDDVSNETMEAVIAANADNPQVDGMRLALAERYYEGGDFQSAFPHYLAVADSPDSTESQTVTALIRLGWMTWQGNGEAGTAVDLFDQALSIDADSDTARYLKAQVLWCGPGDSDQAAALLEEVLADPELTGESRDVVLSDLDAIESGASCS
ncbi:MAG TPA: cytochrome c-type biogenesis protein CcmH [Acidimicrobiia bacterium]|nr:cytochrome c-type biogenesis protein CcmH [Acidimicrobiia bacterium]